MKLTVNRNTVPFDERPPTVGSGVRVGTPAATMRGFDEDDFREVGAVIVRGASATPPTSTRSRARRGALRQAAALPGFRGFTSRTEADDATVPPRALTHVTHPLVQHKLSYLRDKDTPTVHFRKLVEEVTLLLTYEATKDFPTEDVEIETPLERADRAAPARRSPSARCCAPGVGMLDGVLSLISSARVGFIGMYRDEETLEPVQYYVKLPGRHGRARRDRARPDARDRQLERRRDPGREGRRRALRHARLPRRGARGIERVHSRPSRTCTSSAPRSTAG